MPDNNEISLESRLEWDFEDINKREWGAGEWLNEPDKVQCITEGYHCIILRTSHTGALCGYIGVDKAHPCYGLNYDGISSLISDILRAEFRDELVRTKGDPYKMNLTENPEPTSPAGRALRGISVHGGLTYSGVGSSPSKSIWLDFRKNFEKARKQARIYPKGDSARWLRKWAKAEHSYDEFRRITEQTCICLAGLYPPGGEQDGEADGLWWLGFDCAHAGDLAPGLASLTKKLFQPSLHSAGDVYRNLEYVEGQCQQLATQLRAIEEALPGESA